MHDLDVEYKTILTATPMVNKPPDLYSLLKLIWKDDFEHTWRKLDLDISEYMISDEAIADPTQQDYEAAKTELLKRRQKLSEDNQKKAMNFSYCFQPHSLPNLMFRYADSSKGDRAQALLRCRKCSGSNYVIDRTPRYEIFTGVYLPHLRRLTED